LEKTGTDLSTLPFFIGAQERRTLTNAPKKKW
jgi:hypothetical protein